MYSALILQKKAISAHVIGRILYGFSQAPLHSKLPDQFQILLKKYNDGGSN